MIGGLAECGGPVGRACGMVTRIHRLVTVIDRLSYDGRRRRNLMSSIPTPTAAQLRRSAGLQASWASRDDSVDAFWHPRVLGPAFRFSSHRQQPDLPRLPQIRPAEATTRASTQNLWNATDLNADDWIKRVQYTQYRTQPSARPEPRAAPLARLLLKFRSKKSRSMPPLVQYKMRYDHRRAT